jgi:hypothetical protein
MHGADLHAAVQLLVAGLFDEVRHVAEHGAAEAAKDVHVFVAVDVPQVAAHALVHHHLVDEFLGLWLEAR